MRALKPDGLDDDGSLGSTMSFLPVVEIVVGESPRVPQVSSRNHVRSLMVLKPKHMISDHLLSPGTNCLGRSGSHPYFPLLRVGHLSFDR